MVEAESKCGKCSEMPVDILAVIKLLCRLKKEKCRGEVTIRLDGSGRIRSQVVHSVTEILIGKGIPHGRPC
jgi:hypothetical protein